jgi:hypothetical protein
MHRLTSALVAIIVCLGSAAYAAEPSPLTAPAASPVKPCAFSIESGRLLFNNTGTWASQERVGGSTGEVFCGIATPIGTAYGDVWGYAPWNGLADGGEVDGRLGLKNQYGPIGIDVSAAIYHFNVLGAGSSDVINMRGKVSYDILSPGSLALQVYAMGDYGHAIDLETDEYSVVGGLYAGYQASAQWHLGATLEVWHHTVARETVFSLGPKVTFSVWPDLDVYVRGIYTHGSIVSADPETDKLSGMLGLTYRF